MCVLARSSHAHTRGMPGVQTKSSSRELEETSGPVSKEEVIQYYKKSPEKVIKLGHKGSKCQGNTAVIKVGFARDTCHER